MKKPDIVILRETVKENTLLAKIYGITFELTEGSSEGYSPLSDIAKELEISIEVLNLKLKEKSILDEDGNISTEKCWIEGVDGKHIEKNVYAFLILQKVFDFPEGTEDISKVKTEDLIDKGIYGHVQFITDLLNPVVAEVKKISPKDGDIIVINGNGKMSKREKQFIWDKLEVSEVNNMVMFIDGDISARDEAGMRELGWVRAE